MQKNEEILQSLHFSFFEPLPKADTIFGIRHFAGRVVYDADNFLQNNRDTLPDDVVAVFSKQNCNFGFVSHLFVQENKPMAGGEEFCLILFISVYMCTCT